MKYSLAIQLVSLLSVSMASMAAKVEYQHPEVTIVAVDETLDSVLKALGKEMQITVTVPIGINPIINCDIQNRPLERAFNTLLGDISYSLVWADNGERLAGLVILSGDGEPAVTVAGTQQTSSPRAEVAEKVSIPTAREYDQSAETGHNQYDDDPRQAEHESEMAAERLAMEARMAEEREEREIEMEQRRQEEEIAHEVRRKEDEVRHKAWMSGYLETYSPELLQQ